MLGEPSVSKTSLILPGEVGVSCKQIRGCCDVLKKLNAGTTRAVKFPERHRGAVKKKQISRGLHLNENGCAREVQKANRYLSNLVLERHEELWPLYL